MRIFVLIATIVLSLFGAAGAVTIEFTYFEPDRHRSAQAMRKAWGENWTWPLKTFPRHQRQGPELTESYGLVYWPGETVTVHLKGEGKVDRIECVNTLGSDALEVVRQDDGAWTIPIPPDDTPKLLKIYRVRAMSGDAEVASRGLIVTRPWSGVRAVQGDPFFFRIGAAFGEWANGSNPWCVMSFMVGYHTFVEDFLPMRNRPWGLTDAFGLAEFYNWPRLGGERTSKPPAYTSEAYADPTLDWNTWWIYYGRGVSKWEGEWQWGPFSRMSVEHVSDRMGTYDYGVCYGDVKKYSSAYPNGLLFWQWGFYGLKQLAAHLMTVRHAPQFTYDTYDGWEEGLGGEGKSEEVGIMALYYKRCQAEGLDTSWTEKYASFADFRAAQRAAYKTDRFNDYNLLFRNLDLNRKNFYMYELAVAEAYRDVTGKERDFYGGAIGQPGMIDRAAVGGLRQDKRWIGSLWNDFPFNNGRGGNAPTGDDYSHPMVAYLGTDWFKDTRWYRAHGYRGGTLCALWPAMYYGGGHNHTHVMPLKPGAVRTIQDWKLYNDYVIDGPSYRRMDLFERATMFYRPGGKLVGYELAFCFGGWHSGSDDSTYSEVPLWNTQAVLGDQVMEIADRVRPIGGVFVFDSNNQSDREAGREFLTERPFSDLIAALHDELGIITYANPDTEKDIPADIPRVYAPRRGGPGKDAVLTAQVGDKLISVPYTGPEMQTPAHPQFQEFVRQIRDAYAGGWPIRTEGGFVAAGWESSNGLFVIVENPMEAKGVIHTARKGSVTVRLPAGTGNVAVFDLCGDEPDPRRLGDGEIVRDGDAVKILLDWPHGDARLFWITPIDAPQSE
jgi:hypothetical protein